MPNIIKARFKLRSGTTADWLAHDEVMANAEVGEEITTSGERLRKVGNGVDKFSDLPYRVNNPVDRSTAPTDGQTLVFNEATGLLEWKDAGKVYQPGTNITIDNPTSATPTINSYAGIQIDDRVATYADILAISNPEKGWTVYCESDKMIYIYDGSAWPDEGSGVSISGGGGTYGSTFTAKLVIGDEVVGTLTDLVVLVKSETAFGRYISGELLQSVRIYSDALKLNELPREVIGGNIYVLLPTATADDTIWIEVVEGRSDHADTSAYGAHSVWKDYNGVYHDGTPTHDSSGNNAPGTISEWLNPADSDCPAGPATRYASGKWANTGSTMAGFYAADQCAIIAGVKRFEEPNDQILVSNYTLSNKSISLGLEIQNRTDFRVYINGVGYATNDYASRRWSTLIASLDRINGKIRVYSGGRLIGQNTDSIYKLKDSPVENYWFGRDSRAKDTRPMDGYMSEIWFRKKGVDEAYARATHQSLMHNRTFFSSVSLAP